MNDLPNDQVRKALGYWLALLIVTCGLSLIAAFKRPQAQMRVIDAPPTQTKESSTPTRTTTVEEETSSTDVVIEVEKLAEPEQQPKPWDITELEQIKVMLKDSNQDKFRQGITALVRFLERGDAVPSRLATLPENEYDRIYDVISHANSRISWRWKTERNWKAIHHLTLWTYNHFPYKEGWFTGNKNHIEEMHEDACDALRDVGPEYLFVKNDKRPKWLGVDKGAENVYDWPTGEIVYKKPFDQGSYEQMKERLEKFENLLEKAKESLDLSVYIKVTENLKSEFEAMSHVLAEHNNPVRAKSEKRFYKTLASSTSPTRDGVKSALKTTKLGKGFRNPEAYAAARSLYTQIKDRFSAEYKKNIENLIKDVDGALAEYAITKQ